MVTGKEIVPVCFVDDGDDDDDDDAGDGIDRLNDPSGRSSFNDQLIDP